MKQDKSIRTPLDKLDIRTARTILVAAVIGTWLCLALCVNAPEPIRAWALMWSGLGCFMG